MKYNRKMLASMVAASVFTIGGLGNQAMAANSISANARVTLAAAMNITESTALNFGAVSAGTAGTVQISTAGAQVLAGGAVDTGSAAASQGIFAVTGTGTYTYAVSLPASTTVGTMTVNTFTYNCNGYPTCALVAGADTVNVGATLTLNSSVAGQYTGNYTIAVGYN